MKSVLLTRPASSDDSFSALLCTRGIDVVHLPMIEIRKPASWDAADEAIDTIGVYSGILFTSANAVRFFLRRYLDRGGAHAALPPVHAVGKRTAAALREQGVEAGTIPERASSADLAAALGEVSNCFFLQPGSDIALPALRDAVARQGGRVHQVAVYSTARPDPAALRSVDTRLIEGGIDCIAFFSPSAVNGFTALIPEFRQSTVLVAVVGQTTAAAAATAGLRVDVIAPEASAEALAGAIIERFESDDRVEMDGDAGWDLA